MNTPANTYGTKPIQLRLKPELHEWVRSVAVSQERSANWLLNKIVADAKEAAEPKPN